LSGVDIVRQIFGFSLATEFGSPEDVLRQSGIIEAGQSKYYHHAVSWLTRARMAYQAAGREADWQAYLGGIRARHGRKYKLMRMLRGFG
jgi:uncharacterized Zn finger protein